MKSSRDVKPWAEADDPALALALSQMSYYQRRRNVSRLAYQVSEVVLLMIAAATTLAAALGAAPAFTASLAALTVFLTGFRQAFDPHVRWIACAQACERIREAIWNYKFEDSTPAAQATLVDVVRETAKEESGQWLSIQQARRSQVEKEAARRKSRDRRTNGAD